MTANILKLTAKSFILGKPPKSLCHNILMAVTLTSKRPLPQNPSPEKCLATMVALKTKDRMESLPSMKFTMQTIRTYGSVIYVHLRHLPPPIEAIVAFC